MALSLCEKCLNTGKYEPEKTPYLDTFHAVFCIYGRFKESQNCISHTAIGFWVIFVLLQTGGTVVTNWGSIENQEDMVRSFTFDVLVDF